MKKVFIWEKDGSQFSVGSRSVVLKKCCKVTAAMNTPLASTGSRETTVATVEI